MTVNDDLFAQRNDWVTCVIGRATESLAYFAVLVNVFLGACEDVSSKACQHVSKFSLATSVLSHALADLLLFGLVFMWSIASFAQMFYMQLGPYMRGYSSFFLAMASSSPGDGWEEHVYGWDPASGQRYFFRLCTGESRWGGGGCVV